MSLNSQPRVLVIWRLFLSIFALIPAFFLSLFLRVFSVPWIICNTLWIILYLYYFMYHFPRYCENLQITVDKKYLTVRSGVFYSNVHIIPCEHVQFIVRIASPFDRLFRLVSLRVVAAGGFVLLPGLRPEDADALTDFLNHQIEVITEEGSL